MGDFKIKSLDSSVFDAATMMAKRSKRLRMYLDLRNSENDQSQRMLNAIEPGFVLPIHRHTDTSEICIVLRGAAVEIFYDEYEQETERINMMAGGSCCGVNIPARVWHRIESLKSGTVIFEAKDGSYSPISPNDVKNS